MLDRVAWVAFIGLLPPLWISGLWLFAHSGLTRSKKAIWSLVLVGTGVAIGLLLPLGAIRNRFLIVLALIPVLAGIDVGLARSNRSLLFWARACSFEVCTVFACAALTRLALTLR